MELLLISTENQDLCDFNWDISVKDGIAETVPEDAESDQEANVITYLETNTVPLLEDKGVDWPGFLTRQKTISQIDAEIRKNLKLYLNNLSYTPAYSVEDGKLAVRITRTTLSGV